MKKIFYLLVAFLISQTLLPNASVYAQCTGSVVPTTSIGNAKAQISGNTVVWQGTAGGVNHIFKYDGTTTTQLSTTSTYNTDPQIEGNTVVWTGHDGTNYQIYKHDGTTLTQLSTTSTNNGFPQISGNTVVWFGKVGGVNHIFKHDGTTVTQLSTTSINNTNPQISGNTVVWSGHNGTNYQIYKHDGTTLTQLSTTTIGNDLPQIDGNTVVWVGYDGTNFLIYQHDGTTITQLSTTSTANQRPQIEGNTVVWEGTLGGVSHIFKHDGTTLTQLSTTSTANAVPQISGNTVVWIGTVGGVSHIFKHDGTTLTQLSTTSTANQRQQISGNTVVWDGDAAGVKNIYLAKCCTQVATATQTMMWTGAVNNDWANACNWSPNGVPTATNPVSIENVANDPVVLNGTTANCQGMTLHGLAILTINNGGVMNVTGTAITVSINASVVNNGTLSVSSTSFFSIEFNGDNASVTNSGTLTLTNSAVGIALRRNNNVVTNTSTGIINLQSTAVGFRLYVGTTGQTVTNQGTINYSGAGYALILEIGQIFNNSGTFNITNGAGIAVQAGTLNNLACGKVLLSAGSIDNSATGSLTTNAGLIVSPNISNTNGTFTNTGVVNRLPTSGTVNHTANSAVHVRSNTTPIFVYGGTFDGTINGIFTDAAATASAGTFTAPNTFVPSGLPAGSQTLYAKITPSGGACSYVVPFTYNNVAKKLFVKADAAGANNGASWTDALTNLQSALAIAITGDEIWVAKGTYKPTADASGNTNPTDPRTKTFVMKDGVKIYGSFAGTEANLSERTLAVMAANPAILSGDFNGDDMVSGSGSTLSITGNAENSIHVIDNNYTSGNPLTATAVLDGFVITGGNANATAGGGMSNSNASPSLSNLTFSGNNAFGGGGMSNFNSNPVLKNITFSNNMANSGGGMRNYTSIPSLTNVSFSGNNATTQGGGMSNAYTGPSLSNVSFFNNNAHNDGGAIFNALGASPNISNSIFWGNTKNGNANAIGADIFNGSGTTTVKNTLLQSPNTTNNYPTTGGGKFIFPDASNIFAQNPLFVNATDPDGADDIFRTADDGLMLSVCSPAINAGNNADIPSGITTDIVGNPRTFNTTVDMGAYEVQAASTPIPTITLGTIPTTILAGTTTFSIPYTATGTPTTYSISGTGFTTVTDATLPNSPITVNLSASISVNIDFTLTVKNAAGCTSSANTGKITMITPITDACATANFIGIAPIAPTTTTAGVGGKGGIYTYTVPAGVTAIRLDARGAKGGSSPNHFNNTFVGGQGGRVQATYAVTPGDVLYILVGGKGGNGSIDNGVQERTASGGGGATVVSKGPIGTGTLLLVAGGGGGAGHSGNGGHSNNFPGSGTGVIGAGGASFSANGGNSTIGDIGERDCGQGGQALNAGGNGGANACFRPETNGGGYGGGGAGNYSTPNNNAGGGGGGGYVGGNAGGTAGGNGGSSYNAPSASNVTINNHSDDNGSVKITIVGSISYTGSPFCKSLMATSAPTTTGYTGGIFSSTSGLTIDATTGVINPSTSTTGTYTVSYNVSGSNTCPVVATTTVTIIALPNAQASNTGPYSVGQTIQLSATGGLTYSWSGPNGFTSNISNPLINNTLQSNEGVYTVIVSNGICTATATTNVVVIDPCVQIMQYSYVQAGNPYEALFDLTNGMNIAQNTNPTSILVRPICPSATIESVNMTISGPVNYTILQNIQPFSLFDNFGNNVYGQVLPAGTYTLTVTGYAQDNLNGGITYGPVVTTFTIVGNMPTISMPTFTGTSFCSGSSLRVNFSTTGTFSTSNQFQILLSDANGNFNNAQVIGTSASAGNVSCTIPSQATGGVNYRLKVISTDPAASGNYNPTFVIIYPKDLNLVSPTDDMNTNIGTKQASQSITATNKVNSPASVIYQAGKSITFNAGFEAKIGSVFKAHIDGCGNN